MPRRSRSRCSSRGRSQATDAHECVAHLILFRRQLTFVGVVLEAAAAALTEVTTWRLDAPLPRHEQLLGNRFGEATLHLRHARADAIARQSSTDEDHEARVPRDSVPAVRERVHGQLEQLSRRDRRSHRPVSVPLAACGRLGTVPRA